MPAADTYGRLFGDEHDAKVRTTARQSAQSEGLEGEEAEEYVRSYVTGYAEARDEERQRCASIIKCSDAHGRFELAKTLACETDLSVEAARAIMRSTPAQAEPKPAKAHVDQFTAMMQRRGLITPETSQDDDDAEAVLERARRREPKRH